MSRQRSIPSPSHKRRGAFRVGASVIVGFTSALLATSCGSSQSPGNHPTQDGSAPPLCRPLTSAEANLAPPPKQHSPESVLWVRTNLPVDQMMDRLAQEIPKTLAHEKGRPVGAPGKATFKVTRGQPKLSQEGSNLALSLPLSLDISVCKPFGSACLRYGRCSPRLTTKFVFKPRLGEDYRMAPPRGSVFATKKCQIGMDVTDVIVSAAKKEVRKVEAQIARTWPDFRAETKALYRHLAQPIALEEGRCVYFRPKAIEYRAPFLKEQNSKDSKSPSTSLISGMGIRGEIREAPDCTSSQKLPPLPAPVSKSSIPKRSHLFFPESLDEERVTEALASSLQREGEFELLKMTLGEKQVALKLRSDALFCEPIWVHAKWTEREDGQLGLKEIRLNQEESSETADSEWFQAEVAPLIESAAQVPLELSTKTLELRREELAREVAGSLPKELEIKLKHLKMKGMRVHATQNGLRAYRHLEGEARVVAAAPPVTSKK